MKCREMIEYLKRFGPEEEIAALIVDPEKRLYYKPISYQLMDEVAALLFEVSGAEPLDDLDDEVDERKCRVCGCTQYNACEGGCYWVEDDLCSKCVEHCKAK